MTLGTGLMTPKPGWTGEGWAARRTYPDFSPPLPVASRPQASENHWRPEEGLDISVRQAQAGRGDHC